MRDYAAQNLWEQSFSRDSMKNTWRRAITRTVAHANEQAKKTGDSTLPELLRTCIPEDCRPYDLVTAF